MTLVKKTALAKSKAAVQKLRNKIREEEKLLQTKERELRQECKHENIIERDYEPSLFGARPPYRLCTDCGLAEKGWGSGYHILKGDDIPMCTEKTFLKKQEACGYELWGWCYGDRGRNEHPVPRDQLTHCEGTRCEKHAS